MVIRYLIYFIFFTIPVVSAGKTTGESAYNINYYQSGVKTLKPDLNLWQRELLTINLEVSTAEEFSYLKTGKLSAKNYIIESKVIEHSEVIDKGIYKKEMRIYIWPLNHGEQLLKLSDIRLILSGKTIQKIKLPELKLNVKTLPDYLPPGFPVGNIRHSNYVQSGSLLSFLLKPGELSSYTLNTHTTGIHPSLVPDYSNYLKSSDITRLLVSDSAGVKDFDIQYSFTRTQLIPVVAKSSGINSFNEFRILYFDPLTGKINSFSYHSAMLITLNTIFQLIVILSACIILYILLFYFLNLRKNFLTRRAVWKSIYYSHDSIELSLALRNLPVSYYLFKEPVDTKDNISLNQWALSWLDQTLVSETEQLVCLQFAETTVDNFIEIKENIIKQLKKLDNLLFYISHLSNSPVRRAK
ncbi:MAG: hypothetical protein KAQ67_06540 [Gammaproteobacteria bacterium]|nr:hypothetical protein [Gammaproteobacteria bacterium]